MPDNAPPSESPFLRQFAAGLRALHLQAGKPSYRELTQRTGYGRTVLSEALNGRHLPTWPVTRALVQALDADPELWRPRWAEASRARADGGPAQGVRSGSPAGGTGDRVGAGPAAGPGGGEPVESPGSAATDAAGPAFPGWGRRRWPVLGAAATGVLLAALLGASAMGEPWPGRPLTPQSTGSPAATDPGDGLLGGFCIEVTAKDVRVFTSPTGMEVVAVWTTGTRFWADGQTTAPPRYRTVLRDGRSAWVTASSRYTASADGCP